MLVNEEKIIAQYFSTNVYPKQLNKSKTMHYYNKGFTEWPNPECHNNPVKHTSTVLPVKSDSEVMFCLQNYQGLRVDKSLVY